ncbi:MAG: lamin tail domain-containing protein [Bacteroidia bacterium]|nr:lamin tail domain-containing protein [Bacteroidia bacterium]
MKKLFTLCLLLAAVLQGQAQINSFPSTEGFEQTFTTGLNVQFIPNWTANEVSATTSRVFRDSVNFRSGQYALAAIPTTAFSPEIVISLDQSGQSNMTMDLWAKSEANGTGSGATREAVVYISTSIDGGLTYGPATQLGDTSSFPNASTAYSNYVFPFPPSSNNQPNVRLRISVTRGNGTTGGTAARFVMDDVTFVASASDIFPPTVLGVNVLSTSSIEVLFSEPVGLSAENTANYTGIPGLSSAVRNGTNDVVTLGFGTPFQEGVFYSLTVAAVADIAGNVMTNPQSFSVVFNDNTGNIKITELMYNDPGPGTDSLEFVEIRNLDSSPIVIGGWRWSAGLSGVFPSGLVINPGEYKIFAHYPASVDGFFGVSSIAWDPAGALNNTGENVAIINASGVLIDSVSFLPSLPWDTLANGYGHSLVLCNESSNNDDPGNWAASYDTVGLFNTFPVAASPGGPCVTVGIAESNVNEIPLSLYPVPAGQVLNLKFVSEVYGAYTVRITDLSGRLMAQQSVQALAGDNKFSLSVSDLATGVYMLLLDGDFGSSQLRFIKE